MLVPKPRMTRADWPARVMPVLPLLTVTVFAGFGQVLAGVDAYTPSDWDTRLRVLVAIGIAIGLEMIAVYIQWHAHDALLLKATATAARLRRVSYLVAGAVAAFQYSHFAAPGGAPTAASVVFAAFSASSPWLWGLHTRRAQHLQLLREGHADAGGATFSAERWRAFPVRTWKARRFSIDHSINDPRKAWEGYREASIRRSNETEETSIQAATGPASLVVMEDETATVTPTPLPTDLAARADVEKRVEPAKKPALRSVPARAATPTVHAPVDNAQLVAACRLLDQGKGRTVLMRELGLKDNQAKELLKAERDAIPDLLARYAQANA